jgi:hypothetical protein
MKSGSVASMVAKLEQSPTTPVGNTSTPVSGRSLVSSLANEIQTLSKASMRMLAKIETLEKQAVLTTTSVREDTRSPTGVASWFTSLSAVLQKLVCAVRDFASWQSQQRQLGSPYGPPTSHVSLRTLT